MYCLTRRQMIKLVTSLAASEFLFSKFGRAAAASSTNQRRYLLNFMGRGGWDSSFFWDPPVQADLGISSLGDGSFNYPNHPQYTRDYINNNYFGIVNGAPYKPRFNDQDLIRKSGITFGPGMKMVSDNAISRTCFVSGISAEGGHEVGNQLIMRGHGSAYAIYFPGIAAGFLSQFGLRPMHFISTNPNNDYVGQGSGFQLPISIPSQAVWVSMSNASSNDFMKDAVAAGPISEALHSLSDIASMGKIKSTQDLYQLSYKGSIDSSDKIIGENFASNSAYGFQALIDSYVNAVVDAWMNPGGLYEIYNQMFPDRPLWTPNSLDLKTQFRNFMNGYGLQNMAYEFALAEFVVKFDLAAVFTGNAFAGDFHSDNHMDFLFASISSTLFFTLIDHLSNIPLANGGSLLDLTTCVMSTELNRTYARTKLSYDKYPGTSHASATSALIAGAGVRGGHKIGGRSTGPFGPYASVEPNYDAPLPIGSDGVPIASGKLYGQRCLAPTILDILGTSVPPQQVAAGVSPIPKVKV